MNTSRNSNTPIAISRDIFIPSIYDGILLEARVTYFRNPKVIKVSELQPVNSVVISHPYGPLGGNNENNVVIALEHFFLRRGYLTVAFNFRGSGKSQGRNTWSGEAEAGDYNTMLQFLANCGKDLNSSRIIMEIPPIKETIVAGYSYGSLIATTLSSITNTSNTSPFPFPISFILISYPLSVIWFLTFFRGSKYSQHMKSLLDNNNNCRVLFVYGTSDQFTGVNAYKKWIRESKVEERSMWSLRELSGVDHFFFGEGMEEKLLHVLEEWIVGDGNDVT
ncbi:6257_t:CDS:2 [Ambispora leptoticha]|uniref:6257_t:CDS:1 n=1 Tax=Ambispora leptoticha TaxID=144679 RepID=A0A9N9FE14_9GLOM|nr:6257_t:CDS:2 [Ambispora leptoticha]